MVEHSIEDQARFRGKVIPSPICGPVIGAVLGLLSSRCTLRIHYNRDGIDCIGLSAIGDAPVLIANRLMVSYLQYIIVKECREVSHRYIGRSERKSAKKSIKRIENYYKKVSKKLDTQAPWDSAAKQFDSVISQVDNAND